MDYNGKKILVTGAAGLIGREICKQLSNLNCDVVGIDNNSRYTEFIPDNCQYFKSDLIDFLSSTDLTFDYIFHMAAVNGTTNFYNNPSHTLRNNITLDLEVFKFAEDNGCKVIYASTSEVVVDSAAIPTPEEVNISITDIHNPRWSYRLPKILSENFLFNSNLDFVIIRFFNIFSEHSASGHFVHDVIKNIKDKNFSLIGANETRSFCYVEDAADAVLNIVNKVNKDIVNVGNDREIKILDAANIIANQLGVHTVDWNLITSRTGSVSRRCPDISKLRSLYPSYNPRSFEDAFKEIKYII
jgi:nucleoside-diphosphate-sugar epimerase